MSLPSTIGDLITFTLSQPPLQVLGTTLRNLAKAEGGEALLATHTENDDPLTAIDPSIHSLTYLYILSARLSTTPASATAENLDSFCRTFDRKIASECPERVTYLARAIYRTADESGNIHLAIQPLLNLVQRYPPTPAHLTTIHPIFLKACVKAMQYSIALDVLDRPILQIDKSISDLSYTDNLVYHYLGGIVYAVLKRYAQAEECFEIVITSPAQVISAIQVEAMKKLFLLQLIVHGQPKSPPRYANPGISRMFKQSRYVELSRLFPNDLSGLRSHVERELTTFVADGNVGLIRLLIEQVPRRLIRKLTETYVTLSISAINKHIHPQATPESAAETLSLVLSMIENNEIYGTISVSENGDHVITFHDPPPPLEFDPHALEKILRSAQEQVNYVDVADRELARSKDFLSKMVKDKEHNVYEDMEASFPPTKEWDDM